MAKPRQYTFTTCVFQPKQFQLLKCFEKGSKSTWLGYGGSRGAAKALEINTLIPTISGFCKMADLNVGDTVFAMDGSPTKITSVTEIVEEYGYAVIFDTGEEIICNLTHEWVTMNHVERVAATHRTEKFRSARRAKRPSRAVSNPQKGKLQQQTVIEQNKSRKYEYLAPSTGSTKITKEIMQSLTVQNGREVNHSIDVSGSLKLKDIDLPIPPYLLGLWLGDGFSRDPVIGMNVDDIGQILPALPKPDRIKIEGAEQKRKQEFVRATWYELGFWLRQLRLINNKHIPMIYMRASEEQRREILRGLLDTDGTCPPVKGDITFCTTKKTLADDVLHLISSLGIKATIGEGEAKISGRYISQCYRINFLSPFVAFHLERKFANQKTSGFRPTVTRRYIKDVVAVGKVKVKCITVDHPSGTYLVGKTCIPTHNSRAAREIMLTLCWSFPNQKYPKPIKVCIIRRTYELVRENHIDKMLSERPEFRKFYHVTDKELRLPNGSVIAFRGMEGKKEVDEMIGKEYAYIVVDQAEAFTESELNTFKSCVRWSGDIPFTPRMLLTFNPGGIGAGFLKRIFIDKKYTAEETNAALSAGRQVGENYHFIQAYGWDNVEWVLPALTADGVTVKDYYHNWTDEQRFAYFISRSEYGRDINSKPPSIRDGWLFGNFRKYKGQFFDNFTEDRIVKEFWTWPDGQRRKLWPEEWHERSLGIDWAFGHPTAAYWGAQVESDLFYVYREWLGSGRSAKAVAQEICDRTPMHERPMIKRIGLSHDAFAQRDERDPVASQMGEVFRREGLPYPTRAGRDQQTSENGSATWLYEAFGPYNDEAQEYADPTLLIHPSCVRLIETVPMVSLDGEGGIIKFDADETGNGGDDPYDGLRHLIFHRLGHKVKPREKVIREQAAKIEDKTARWLFLTKQLTQNDNAVIDVDYRPAWER